MKKFLLFTGCTVAGLIILVYLAFLFYLPRAIDLNTYLPEVQKIAKEQANIDISVENPKIVTTFNLQAGLKTDKISVNLPDGSNLLSAEGILIRISLPRLLLLTIKVPCAEVISPKVNLEIANNEQFKVVQLVEDILNKQKNEPPKISPEEGFTFDPSIIKIQVPGIKLTNYIAVINDLKSGHTLTLRGEKLLAGYNNGKTAKVKTYAELLSDDNTNITANIDIDTLIPEPKPEDPDDDPVEKIVLPFVNPVLIYRDYDLKSDIDTKIKVRLDKEGMPILKGHFNVDNTTINLSGLQLPKSYIKSEFFGKSANIDSNLVIKDGQEINTVGKIRYDKNPKLDMNIVTDRIYFNDMIILARAFLDTLHIKNDLNSLKAEGYWAANAQINTDFKKIKSQGCAIARNGKISNASAGLLFDRIHSNLILQNNSFDISDTHMYINGNILKADGRINSNSYANITVESDKLPLPGLFRAFAPSDVKKNLVMKSGDITINAHIMQELTKPMIFANVVLDNLQIADKAESFILSNEKLMTSVVTDIDSFDGRIKNKNLSINLPQTKSVITNPSLNVVMDKKDVKLDPLDILLNDTSKIIVLGNVANYTTDPQIDIISAGKLNAEGIRKFAGRDAEPFIAAQGNIPLRATIKGDAKKQSVVLQIKSDAQNYITPVHIQSMQGNQSILQAKFDYKGDRLHIRNTGLYTGVSGFSNDIEANMANARPVAELSGTIVNLDTADPFINLIKFNIPNEISGKISAFNNSSFNANGKLLVFGRLASPLMRGNFKVQNLSIPELMTKMDETDINLSGKNIVAEVKNLLLNGSDINITARTDINPHPMFTISGLDVRSNLIDLDKLMPVTEALAKYQAPPLPNAKPAKDIPVVISNGTINLRRIKTGNIVATNTTGRISMHNNNFYLQRLRTTAFEGIIRGNIVANLITMALDIKTRGTGLDSEAALLALANMKDTLTGDLAFTTDIQLQGVTMEEQMKSLKGTVNFTMTDGQLGPFGKLENMILAENIRENQFFQTALGGVINNLATVDTSHFSEMKGKLTFKDGIAHINPISSTGNVMCLYIFGDFNLLENKADLKVRAKLGSVIANLLGPLAQLNPINLVQATPGLNVVMAKMFFLFCEQLTPEESAVIPDLPAKLDDKMATKFQIVLRGDVAKPLTLIKSFKWLALASEIEQAESFVNSLPDPSLVEDPNNATLEAVMAAQEAKAKEDAKLINKVKRFFKKEKESI